MTCLTEGVKGNQLEFIKNKVEPKAAINPIPSGFISHSTYGIAVGNMVSGILKEITNAKEVGAITQIPLGDLTYEDISNAHQRVKNSISKVHTDNVARINTFEQGILDNTYDSETLPKVEDGIRRLKLANLELSEMMRSDNHRLLEDTTKELKSLGIKTSLAKLKVSLMSDEDYKEFSEDGKEGGETSTKERIYSRDSATINPKDTVGNVIKLYFSTLQEKRYGANGEVVTVRDHKGFPKKLNVQRTLAEIFSVLSDIPTYEGMIEKLKQVGKEDANLASIASDLSTKVLESNDTEYSIFANTFFSVFSKSYTEGKKIIQDVIKEDNRIDDQYAMQLEMMGGKNEDKAPSKLSVISSNTSSGPEGLFNDWKTTFGIILLKYQTAEERQALKDSGIDTLLKTYESLTLSEDTVKAFDAIKDSLHARFISLMKVVGIEMTPEGMNALKLQYQVGIKESNKISGRELKVTPASYKAYLDNIIQFTVKNFLDLGKDFLTSPVKRDNQTGKIKDLARAQRSVGTDSSIASYVNDNQKSYFAVGNADYVKTVISSIKQGIDNSVNRIAKSTRLFKELGEVDSLGKPKAEINRFDTDGSAGDFKEYSSLSQAYTTRLNLAFNPLFSEKKIETAEGKQTLEEKSFNNVGYYFSPILSDRSHADAVSRTSLISRDPRGKLLTPFDSSGNLKEAFSKEFTNITLAEAEEANDVRVLHSLMTKWETASNEHFDEASNLYEGSELSEWITKLKETKSKEIAEDIKSTFVDNYHVNSEGGLGNAGWLQLVPELNTLLEFDTITGAITNLEVLSSPKALEIITSFAQEQYGYFESELISGGFIGKSKEGRLFLTSDLGAQLVQNPKSTNLVDSLQTMFINDLLNGYEYMVNFQGGTQYNSTADFQSYYDSYRKDHSTAKLDLQKMIIDSNKRMSLLTSPQSKGRISSDKYPGGMKPTFNVAICKDIYVKSAFMDMYKAVLGANSESYEEHKLNMTDAQGLCTPERFKDILGGRGAFGYDKEGLFDALMDPNHVVTVEELEIVHSHIKGSYYGLHSHPSGRKMMMNLKYSVMPLFPALINHSKELKAIAAVMKDKEIDEVTFKSAVKVGAYNVNDLIDANGNVNTDLRFVTLDSRFYGEPVTESAEAKSEAGLGTQVNKLINGNMELYKSAIFNVNGIDYAGENMAQMYNDVVNSLLAVGFKDFNGDINTREKLLKTVVEASNNNKYSNDSATLIDQLKYDKETNELEIPFDFPLLNHRVAQQLFTVAKGKVLKLKMPGTTAILATSLGQYSLQEQEISERLKFVRLIDSSGRELTAEDTDTFNKDKKRLVKAIREEEKNPESIEDLTKLTSLQQELAELSQRYTVAPAECVVSGSYFTKRFKEIAKNLTKEYISGKTVSTIEEEAKYEAIYNSIVEQFLFKDGSYNMEALNAAGLLDTFAYRIPTQSKSSALPGKIIRILPEHNGAAIILPAEVTAQSGADFDYDKVVVEMRSFDISLDKKGQLTMEAIAPFGKAKDSLTSTLFNMQRSILTSSMFFEELITPNSTKMFTNAMKDIQALTREVDNRNLSLFSIVTQEGHRIKNRDSAVLIGALANASMLHMIAQQVDISLPVAVSVDSVIYKKLGQTYTNNYELISEVISQAISAAVDNAKDPILGNLNINTLTAPFVTACMLLGIDLSYTTELINSPAISILLTDVSREINKGVSQDSAILKILNDQKYKEVTSSDGTVILVNSTDVKLNHREGGTSPAILSSFGTLFKHGKTFADFYGSINLDSNKPVNNVAGNVRKLIKLSRFMPKLVKESFPGLISSQQSDLIVDEDQLRNHTNGGFIKTGLIDVTSRIGAETGDLSAVHLKTYAMLDDTLRNSASESDFIKVSKVIATTAHLGLPNSYTGELVNFSNINRVFFNEKTNFANDLPKIVKELNSISTKNGSKSILAKALKISDTKINSDVFGELVAKRITIGVSFLKSLDSGEKADVQREMEELYIENPQIVNRLVSSNLMLEGFDRYAGSLKDIFPLNVYKDLGIVEEHKKLLKIYEDQNRLKLPMMAVSNYILNNIDLFYNKLQSVESTKVEDFVKKATTRFQDNLSIPVVFKATFKDGEKLMKLQVNSAYELEAVETSSRGLGMFKDFTLDGNMFTTSTMSEIVPFAAEAVEAMNDSCIG